MVENPALSFIVPVYNVKPYLAKCLDSLLGQTFSDIEIVCVDDCSTDGSYDLLCKYADLDSRVRVFRHEENKRQGAARNTAIKHANGRYLSFVDSDDWVDVTFAEEMMNAACEFNADYVRGGAIDYYSEEKQIREPYNSMQYELQGNREELLKNVCLHGGRMWGGVILRSIIIDNQLWFPERVAYEDNPVGLFHYFLSNNIVVINKDLYYYRCNNQSTTRSKIINDKRILDRIETTNLLLENANRLGLYERYECLFDACYINLLATWTPIMLVSSFRPLPVSQLRNIYSLLEKCDPNWRTNEYYIRKGNRLLRFYLDHLLPLSVPFFGYILQFVIRLSKLFKSIR